MRKQAALAALALLLAGAAQETPFTAAEARKLSAAELERRVFQGVRGTTREVEVSMRGLMPYRAQLRGEFVVDFADAPRATALAGLCAAQVRTAIFGRGYVENAGEKAPTHLLEVTERARYALIPSPADGWSLDTGASCAGLAPVLSNERFFEASGSYAMSASAGEVIAAVGTLQGMFREAAGRRLWPVACTEDLFQLYGGEWKPLCEDAGAVIALLRWDQLSSLSIVRCGEKLCVHAFFPRPVAPVEEIRIVELLFGIEGAKIGLEDAPDIGHVTDISLRGVTAID